MDMVKITDTICYIGADDKTLDLFESQYAIPNGISYNSYLIIDEKVAVMDTVDARVTDEWFANLERALFGKIPDFLVISHMEPDHAANIQAFAEKYPMAKLVVNMRTMQMLPQFFDLDLTGRIVEIKEGDTLELGTHTLQFFMAPMVHWPEVMVTYENSEQILFSADGFGKFGTLDTKEEWDGEAGRYYFNILGKYGAQVQKILKKISGLDIQAICPLHGPVLTKRLDHYILKYKIWSSYEPEENGVLIAYASIHGNTAQAARRMAEMLLERGERKVTVMDLSRGDMSEAVEKAFRYDRLLLCAASYDAGVFPCMEDFLNHLKAKAYQSRTVALIENGSWAPSAARTMKNILETMKNITICEPIITIRSTIKKSTLKELAELAENLC